MPVDTERMLEPGSGSDAVLVAELEQVRDAASNEIRLASR